MPGYTYPAPAPTITNDVLSIHRLLQSPTLIGRRLRTLLEQRYIADALLTGRFMAQGGAISYESGEPIGTAENPRAVAPGSKYPLVNLATGAGSIAKTTKWGQDALVTDEAIARLVRNPVDRAFTKLANQSVKNVDTVALSAIASAVTANTNLGAASLAAATAEQILTAFLKAKAEVVALNEGFDPNTVALDDISWATIMAKFVAAGYLPREAQNPVLDGNFPQLMGMTWLATPNIPVANVGLVVDRDQLGGMADENLGGPGYVKVDGIGVETKSIRDDDEDRYKLRARRVTVPVILEPAAGRRVTYQA